MVLCAAGRLTHHASSHIRPDSGPCHDAAIHVGTQNVHHASLQCIPCFRRRRPGVACRGSRYQAMGQLCKSRRAEEPSTCSPHWPEPTFGDTPPSIAPATTANELTRKACHASAQCLKYSYPRAPELRCHRQSQPPHQRPAAASTPFCAATARKPSTSKI